jgi:hypothetical protein
VDFVERTGLGVLAVLLVDPLDVWFAAGRRVVEVVLEREADVLGQPT